jgi:branched-chain amino acid transport system substrate-binding protein
MKLIRSGRFFASVALVLSGCAAIVATGSGAASAGKSPIVIGNEADLTGNATVGIPGNYGVQFAVKQINAHGGLDGHRIVLKTADSQGSATGGIAAVRQLTESDHVQIIVNTSSSDAAIPSIPIVQQAKVPIIISAASDPAIVLPQNTEVFMSPAVPVNLDVLAYLNYMKKAGYKSVALIYDSAAFADAAVADFQDDAPAQGITLATVQSFAYGATDFSSQISAAQSSNAQAVFVIGDFLGSVLTQARQDGYNVPFMYDASTTDPLLITSLGPTNSTGLVSFQTQATQLLDATTAPMTTWLKDFKADFPSAPSGVPSQFSLEGYEATFVAADAVLNTLTAKKSPTGANILASLNKIKNFVEGKSAFKYAVPIAYPVTFTKSNHAGDHVITPVTVKNGIFVPVSK